jgi:hypothetical protein
MKIFGGVGKAVCGIMALPKVKALERAMLQRFT